MSISGTEFHLIRGRECGPCLSCCCFFTIAELDKPAGVLCRHYHAGCDIYSDRPRACRVFHCAWRSWEAVPDDWRPDVTGFVLGGTLKPGSYLAVTADPKRPFSWRDPAYYPRLMDWAKEAAAIGSQLVVFIEKRVIVLRPEGEEDLGVVAPDEFLISDERGRIKKVRRGEEG